MPDDTITAPAATGTAAAPSTGGEGSTLLKTGAPEGANDAAGKTTDGGAPNGDKGTSGSDNKGDDVPEKYELQAPEGMTLDGVAVEEFSTLAKELKLPAATAQKLADVAIKMAQRQAEATAKVVNEWAEQSRADKEFGGDNLDANLALAKKAVDTFGTPAFKNILESTGLGNHPDVIRYFVKVGKAFSDDTFVKGGNPASANNVPLEKRMYPNMN